MGYRLTVDASSEGKIKAGGKQSARARVLAHAQHVARSVDFDASGQLRNRHFRNEEIDPARTAMNQAWINDGQGGFVAPESMDDVMKGWDRLTAQLDPSKKVRHDAVLLRGVVLNLDEKWLREVCPDWKTNGLNAEAQRMYDALLDEFCEEVGQENVVDSFLHMDEHLPQLQVRVGKVRDGRIASSSVLPDGPKALELFHQSMRVRMKRHGYDVEMKSSERSRERLAVDEVRHLGKEREARVAAGDTSPGADELWTPSFVLGRTIEEGLSTCLSEEHFDAFLNEHKITRTKTAKGGTRYNIEWNDHARGATRKDKPRSASKLPGKPTQSVVEARIAANVLAWQIEQERQEELALADMERAEREAAAKTAAVAPKPAPVKTAEPAPKKPAPASTPRVSQPVQPAHETSSVAAEPVASVQQLSQEQIDWANPHLAAWSAKAQPLPYRVNPFTTDPAQKQAQDTQQAMAARMAKINTLMNAGQMVEAYAEVVACAKADAERAKSARAWAASVPRTAPRTSQNRSPLDG